MREARPIHRKKHCSPPKHILYDPSFITLTVGNADLFIVTEKSEVGEVKRGKRRNYKVWGTIKMLTIVIVLLIS